jgi:hypothetical protein
MRDSGASGVHSAVSRSFKTLKRTYRRSTRGHATLNNIFSIELICITTATPIVLSATIVLPIVLRFIKVTNGRQHIARITYVVPAPGCTLALGHPLLAL